MYVMYVCMYVRMYVCYVCLYVCTYIYIDLWIGFASWSHKVSNELGTQTPHGAYPVLRDAGMPRAPSPPPKLSTVETTWPRKHNTQTQSLHSSNFVQCK